MPKNYFLIKKSSFNYIPSITQVLPYLISLQSQLFHKNFLFKSVNNSLAPLPGKHNLNGLKKSNITIGGLHIYKIYLLLLQSCIK